MILRNYQVYLGSIDSTDMRIKNFSTIDKFHAARSRRVQRSKGSPKLEMYVEPGFS